MIDYIALQEALNNLRPGTKLYKMLKSTLKQQGRWKDPRRGKPMEKGYDPRRGKGTHA